MDVIDLTKARAQRDEDLVRAKAAADTLYDLATQTAKAYADLAFTVSAPYFEPCRQLAQDINRSQLRRAKVVFRGQIRRLSLGREGVVSLMQFLSDTYWDAINHLWWDRLRAMGRDPSAEATAELAAERKPWPSCFMLSDEAIVSWLDLIERTGGKLAPDTRTSLLKARTDLQAGRMLDSYTEALVDRLIRTRWRQGHEMPWTSKWAGSMAESA